MPEYPGLANRAGDPGWSSEPRDIHPLRWLFASRPPTAAAQRTARFKPVSIWDGPYMKPAPRRPSRAVAALNFLASKHGVHPLAMAKALGWDSKTAARNLQHFIPIRPKW
jgi:hypothetical protein